jgi:hypothetical protein
MSDQTLPEAYWEAVERGDDALAVMESHILGKLVDIMVKRMTQGVTIRYFRTRHLGDVQMLADAGVELLRVWFNQRLQDRFNRQGYDEQGHILQQQVQRNINDLVENMPPPQPESPQPEPAQPEPAQPDPPVVEKYEFVITEDEQHLLGQKGGLTERALREAATRYNLEHSDNPIDLTGLEARHFSASSTFRQHLGFQLEGKVRIINGITGKVLFDK